MKPLTGVSAWAIAFAFLGGLGSDSLGVTLVALSACLLSSVDPHKPWRWATLALAGWAAGSAVALLIVTAGAERYFAVPDATETGFAMLAALSAAYLGAGLTWAAGRLARER